MTMPLIYLLSTKLSTLNLCIFFYLYSCMYLEWFTENNLAHTFAFPPRQLSTYILSKATASFLSFKIGNLKPIILTGVVVLVLNTKTK